MTARKNEYFWKLRKFTMFVSCIHISTHIQQGLQTGEPLWLLTGKIQGAALMDLPRSVKMIHIKRYENRGDTMRTGEDTNTGRTAFSPGLSFQCRLRAQPAVSPRSACFSTRRCAEGCSKTLGLKSTYKYSDQRQSILTWDQPLCTVRCEMVNTLPVS